MKFAGRGEFRCVAASLAAMAVVLAGEAIGAFAAMRIERAVQLKSFTAPINIYWLESAEEG